MQPVNKRLFAITGHKHAGKDTLAKIILDHYSQSPGQTLATLAFAWPIKEACCKMFGWDADRINDEDYKAEVCPVTGRTRRYVLQTFGTEWGRDIINPDIWIRVLINKMDRMFDYVDQFIITDVRFENELEALTAWATANNVELVSIRVERDSLKNDDNHASESEIDKLPVQYILKNNYTIQTLTDSVNKFLLINYK